VLDFPFPSPYSDPVEVVANFHHGSLNNPVMTTALLKDDAADIHPELDCILLHGCLADLVDRLLFGGEHTDGCPSVLSDTQFVWVSLVRGCVSFGQAEAPLVWNVPIGHAFVQASILSLDFLPSIPLVDLFRSTFFQ
jgi:hypothetical protein